MQNSTPPIMNREAFVDAINGLSGASGADLRKGMLAVGGYMKYLSDLNAIRNVELNLRLDTLIACSTSSPAKAKPRTKAQALAEKPAIKGGLLFETKPGSRMGQNAMGRMLYLGDEKTVEFVKKSVPAHLWEITQDVYLSTEASKKALANATAKRHPELLNKYRCGYIWQQLSKTQKVAWYSNINEWWNDHKIKYDPILTKEDGGKEKGPEEKEPEAKEPEEEEPEAKEPEAKEPEAKAKKPRATKPKKAKKVKKVVVVVSEDDMSDGEASDGVA